jgi:phosphopantothenate---cysteine ligase (CTP)
LTVIASIYETTYQIQNMNIVITAGPSSEPIDEVRLITNRSTGELGLVLAEAFGAGGHEVNLFLGRLAQFRHSQALYFDRNEDLDRMLREVGTPEAVDVVLHAAALSDFQVAAIRAKGQPVAQPKIASDHVFVSVDLERKPKVIGALRDYFRKALIVGWKLELEGSREDLIREASQQITRNRTDACVINGRAFGEGFGFCTPGGLERTLPSKPDLANFLVEWAEGCER